ncbi:MAG: pirin family protein [Bacillota bacterium]
MLEENKKIVAVEKPEGAGAVVKRLFPTQYHKHLDPFVLIDEFFVEAPNKFSPHEHKGFEAVSYLLGGDFRHEDNIGNEAEVSQGGLQAFNAGGGIIHSEAPGTAGYAHGMQIWVNLPRNLKESDPSYQQLKPQDVPIKKEEGLTIASLIGPGSKIQLQTEVILQDVTISGDGVYNVQLGTDMQGFIYVIDGAVKAEFTLKESEALLVAPNSSLEVTPFSSEARIIFAAGKSLGDEIRIKGSFVA